MCVWVFLCVCVWVSIFREKRETFALLSHWRHLWPWLHFGCMINAFTSLSWSWSLSWPWFNNNAGNLVLCATVSIEPLSHLKAFWTDLFVGVAHFFTPWDGCLIFSSWLNAFTMSPRADFWIIDSEETHSSSWKWVNMVIYTISVCVYVSPCHTK